MSFYEKINEICKKHNRVALFVDMDGTIVEFKIYPENFITYETKGLFENLEPVRIVIDKLREVSKIDNLDIYILSLSRSNIIYKEKVNWLKKYAPFIKPENQIILIRENGDYNLETRSYVKSRKMLEMTDVYDYVLLLDDEHNILKTSQAELGDKGEALHISSALI